MPRLESANRLPAPKRIPSWSLSLSSVALSFALAACGESEPAVEDVADLSLERLVAETPRACPATPSHAGPCGFGHKHDGGRPLGAGKITIASCNGVDDTAVIQDALTRADEVQLPVGTCAVSGLAVVKKPTKLSGRGRGRTVLKYRSRAGDSCMFFSNGAHTIIADLTFDGSRETGAVVCGIFVRPKTCVAPVVITRVDVRNIADRGIVVSGDGVGSVNGVADNDPGVGANPVLVTDNRVTSGLTGISVGTTSIPNVRNVDIRRNDIQSDSEGGATVRGVAHAMVANNRTRGGISGVALESGGSDVRFCDNDISGASLAGILLGGGSLNSGSDISVSGNRVTKSTDGALMQHMSAGRFRNVAFIKNDFSGNSGAGLTITAGESIVVGKNHFEGNGAEGVRVLAAPPGPPSCGERCTDVDDLTIVDNVFRAALAPTSIGLLVDNGRATGIVVRGNDLRYDTPAPPYQPVAIGHELAAGELTFDGNLGWPVLTPAP